MSRRLLAVGGGAAGAPGGGPVDPIDPDPVTTVWRQATNKTGSPAGLEPETPGVASTSRTLLEVRNAASALRFQVGGFDIPGDAVVEFQVTATINGTTYPLTFDSGNPTWAMDHQYTERVTDPITVAVVPGDIIDFRVSTSPGYRNTSVGATPYAGEGSRVGTAVTGAWPGNSGAQYRTVPGRLLGAMPSNQPAVAWLLSGDSNMEYAWATGALEETPHAWTNAGKHAERAVHVANRATGSQQSRYGPDSSPWTHAVCELGLNDLFDGTSPDAIKGYLITHWLWLAAYGAKVWQTTISPAVDASSNMSTIEGQIPNITPAGPINPPRVLLNDWIRDGAPLNPNLTPAAIGAGGSVIRGGDDGHPLAAGPCFDYADVMEPSRNQGVFKPYYSSDGTHPSATGVTALQAAFATWLAGID